jgi:DNA-binding NtrC family response regulator
MDSPVRRPLALVADDDDAMCILMRALLERNGFNVATAKNGRDALDSLNGNAADIILLDLLMPHSDGFQLLHELALHNPKMLQRTVVITGTSDGIIRRLHPGEVFAVVRKPFDIDELMGVVRDCMGNGNGKG